MWEFEDDVIRWHVAQPDFDGVDMWAFRVMCTATTLALVNSGKTLRS